MNKITLFFLFLFSFYNIYSQEVGSDKDGFSTVPVEKTVITDILIKSKEWQLKDNGEYLSAENYNTILEALCRNKMEEYKDSRYAYKAEVLTTLPKNGLNNDLSVYYFKDANENYIVYIPLSNNVNEFSKVTEQVSKILTGRKYDPFCSYTVTGFTLNNTKDSLFASVGDAQVEMAIYKHKQDAQHQIVLLTIIQRTSAPQKQNSSGIQKTEESLNGTDKNKTAQNKSLEEKTFFLPGEFKTIRNVEAIRKIKNSYYFFSGNDLCRLNTNNGTVTKLKANAGLPNFSSGVFTDNYVYCLSNENNYYRAWRIDPEADKISEVALPSKKEFKVKPADSKNQNTIFLSGHKDQVLLNYSNYFAPSNSNPRFGTTGDLYVATDAGKSDFVFLDNYSVNGMNSKVTERFGFAGEGSFYKNTFVARQYYGDVDFTKLGYIDYDIEKRVYKLPLNYDVSTSKTQIRLIKSKRDDVFILYEIYDQNSSEMVSRELFKFKYPQIARVGKLGVCKNSDNLAMLFDGDDTYVLSGSSLFKYDNKLNGLNKVIPLKEDEKIVPFNWDYAENSDTYWIKANDLLVFRMKKDDAKYADWKFMVLNLKNQFDQPREFTEMIKMEPGINSKLEKLFIFNNSFYFLIETKDKLADLYRVNFQSNTLEKVKWTDDINKNLQGFSKFSASKEFLKLEAVYENGGAKETRVLLLSTIQ